MECLKMVSRYLKDAKNTLLRRFIMRLEGKVDSLKIEKIWRGIY